MTDKLPMKPDAGEAQRTVLRFVFAAAVVALAYLLRVILTAWEGPGLPTYITFYPAIMMAALLGGLWPGLLATTLSALAVAFWILPPSGQFSITAPIERLGLMIFTGMGMFISVIAELYRRNRRKTAAYDRQAALREGEARLAAFAEATFEGIVESEAGRIVDCNEQFSRMLGYNTAELKGRTIAELIAPEDRERTLANISGNRESVIEHATLHKDGTRIIVEAHGRPSSPGSARRHTVVRDITERKRTEEALRESERLYRSIGETIDYGVWVCAPDGRNIYASESFLNMVGMTQQQCSDFGWGDVLHPDDAERTIAAWKECVRTGGTWDIEHRFRGVDGQWHDVLARGVPVRNDQGQITCWAGINLDISRLKRTEESLRESQERYRIIAENTGDVIWTMDLATQRFTYVSPSILKLRGYTPEETMTQTLEQTLTPESWKDVSEGLSKRLAAIMAGDESARVLTRLIDQPHKDGSIKTVEAVTTILMDAQGRPTTMLGVSRDVTERKRMEAALERARNTLAEAQKIAHLGSFEYVAATQTTVWSEEEYRIYGLNPAGPSPTYEVMLDKSVHPDDAALLHETFTKAMQNGGIYELEHRVVRPDGSVRWVYDRAHPHFDANGKLLRYVGATLDITERKRAEERLTADLSALTRMHALSGRLLEAAGLEPLLQEVMDVAVAIMGAQRGTLQLLEEETLRIAAHHGHQRPFLEFFASAESRASVCGEATKRGERVVVPDVEQSELFAGTPSLAVLSEAGVRAVQSTPILSRTGRLLGILTTQWGEPYTPDEHDLWRIDLLARQAADLIEYTRAEVALRQTVEELARSNRDLEQFAYVSSHDLQEPLRMVSTFGDILQSRYRDTLDSKAREYFGFMIEGARRMQALVDGLQHYSRIGAMGKSQGPLEMRRAVDEAATNLKKTIQESGASITIDPLPTLSADRALMVQLFQNLIGNAIKYRAERPLKVRVGAERRDGKWVFSVADNGIGIDPMFFDKIFEIFQRLHPRERYSGTGIGLAVCKKIVEHYGGRIWVESQPGQGATFFFSLPAAGKGE
jgi:PAS domain S-box-containing protein